MKWLIGLGVLCLVGCGSSADRVSSAMQGHTRSMPGHLKTVSWKVYGPPTGDTIRIISEVGYCRGTAKPRIAVVHVVEKPSAVLLTAKRTVPDASNGNGCADVALGIHRAVVLNKPLDGRALYDSGVSPPVKRWPISKGKAST